jgi:hypothetical protein
MAGPSPPPVGLHAEPEAQRDGGLVGDLIERHWPAIRKVLREKVAPKAVSLASDDEIVTMAARGLHALLPLPIRLVIRPQRLTDWCLHNRDRILSALRPEGPQSQETVPPPGTGYLKKSSNVS